MAFCRHGFAVVQFMQPRLKAPNQATPQGQPGEMQFKPIDDIRESVGLEK